MTIPGQARFSFFIAAMLALNVAFASDEESLEIKTDITLHVPSQYNNINQALTHLANKTILKEAVVTIQVADGLHKHRESIKLTHPNGNRIKIIGNTQSPSDCILYFVNSNGFEINTQSSIALIDGFNIVGNNSWKSGIVAFAGSTANIGPNTRIEYFGNSGIHSQMSSSIVANGVTASNNGFAGFHADVKSSIQAKDSLSQSNGRGFYADNGSQIQANGATVKNNQYGMSVNTSSKIDAIGSVVKENDVDYFPSNNVSERQGAGIKTL